MLMLPLLSFLLLIFVSRKRETMAWLATGIHLATAIAAAMVFSIVWDNNEVHARTLWFQISTDRFRYPFTLGFLIDRLAALLTIVVTVVSTLVHLYSIAYMRGEKHYNRYFAYLGLFTFAMLGIVLMDNLLMIFVFWELVGVSSYALISFWNERPAALQAGSKAFIINRIGDAGFLIGIMVLWSQFGTLDLQVLESLMRQSVLTEGGEWLSAFRVNGQVFENAAPAYWLTISGLGLFCGTIGKSAQFPLQTWLPDAMQGPTPASALIHAATMVAAGVYLLARVFVLLSGDALTIIAFIGSLTAFMGAVAALTQHDIKRVLAFSTISQLGYMVMGVGVGAYDAAVFHLVTHAAFKACLFLAAGSVIHSLHGVEKEEPGFDPQDMRTMGGLRKQLPYTFAAYLVASLSLGGIPLFSGFLSKDAILAGTLGWLDAIGQIPLGGVSLSLYLVIPTLAFVTTMLTALYMGRQVLLVFWGEFRGSQRFPQLNNTLQNLKEPSLLMVLPLGILAVLSLGFVFSLNPVKGEASWLVSGLDIPSLAAPGDFDQYRQVSALKAKWHTVATWLALGFALVGLLSAFLIYRPQGFFAKKYAHSVREYRGFRGISFHNWYLDSFHQYLIVKPVIGLSVVVHRFDQKGLDAFVKVVGVSQVVLAHLIAWFDRYVIDGCLRLLTALVSFVGWLARPVQQGRVQAYFIVSLLLFLVLFYWLVI